MWAYGGVWGGGVGGGEEVEGGELDVLGEEEEEEEEEAWLTFIYDEAFCILYKKLFFVLG